MDVYRDGDAVVRRRERTGDAEDLEQRGETDGYVRTRGESRIGRFKSCVAIPELLTHFRRVWCVCNKMTLPQRANYSWSWIIKEVIQEARNS